MQWSVSIACSTGSVVTIVGGGGQHAVVQQHVLVGVSERGPLPTRGQRARRVQLGQAQHRADTLAHHQVLGKGTL